MAESGTRRDAEVAVGVIAAGSIGARHLRNLAALPDNRVVAVCDVNASLAEATAGRVQATAYTDLAAMFAREPRLDAVLLCAPPVLRREVFELAARRGVAVLCEKPPARTMDEARAIADIIQSSGILCAAGFNWRYSPVVDRARELTRGRLINLVISAYVTNLALTNGLRDWFYLKELSGGLILDQAIHLVDLMRYLMGEIVEVHTFASNAVRPQSKTFTSEDSTTSSLRFASGATGVHVHSWVNPGRSSVIIGGADFTLDINAWSPPELRGTFPGPDGKPAPIEEDFTVALPAGEDHAEPPRQPPVPTHFREMQVFLEAVRTGDASHIRSSWSDAMRSLAVALAMNRSIETGRPEPVEVPG